MEYITVAEAAKNWNLTPRRIRILCAEGKIPGVRKVKHAYQIPSDALKPLDGRSLRGTRFTSPNASRFAKIDTLKAELSKRRPLTQGELERLREEFAVEYTYNSNAIEGSTMTLQETALALSGVTVDQKPLKEHLEAIGHRNAFHYVQRIAGDKMKLTEQTIRDIHALVLIDRPEDKGRYRSIPVCIISAEFEPPQPLLVPQKMEELMRRFRKSKLYPTLSNVRHASIWNLSASTPLSTATDVRDAYY